METKPIKSTLLSMKVKESKSWPISQRASVWATISFIKTDNPEINFITAQNKKKGVIRVIRIK